jgi:pimeloyl-ACP methyl ester carboxylesterase
MSKSIPSYCPDKDRLFYLRCGDSYSICCSLILASGDFVSLDDIIEGGVPIIIFCHGTGSNIGTCYRFGQTLARMTNCHVLLFDYPGYGLSSSQHHPNETTSCLSIKIVLDHVLSQMQVPVENVILCGHSLGTAIATYGMSYLNGKLGGLILLNPFLSLRSAAEDLTPFGCLILERFNTQQMITRCQSPVMIVHGHQDRIIPAQHGVDLFNVIQTDKEGWFPHDADHDHCDLELLYNKIDTFINRYIRPQIIIQDRYYNITPRIPPHLNNDSKSSVITETIATVGEVTVGMINDSYRTCFFL